MAETGRSDTNQGSERSAAHRGARGQGSGRSGARGQSSSRDAFIDTTARLLRRQGYAATGLNEIVARSGAPKGSLYFHFPGGKEQLALAAMDRAGEQLREAITATLASSDDLGEALSRLLDALAAGLEQSGYRDGCPIATVALEAASDSEPLRASAAGAFDSWLAALEQRLRGDGFAPPAARQRALHILSAIEGALILSRAMHDVGPLRAVRDELVALVR
jgi:TetR/AcrR family transcriptional regulator, lmrAB and yxaGH operons repressor